MFRLILRWFCVLRNMGSATGLSDDHAIKIHYLMWFGKGYSTGLWHVTQ